MTRLLPSLSLALLLAACQPGAGDEPVSPPSTEGPTSSSEATQPSPPAGAAPQETAETETEDACGASKVRQYIGEEATVPMRSRVAREAGSSTDRWIYPDSMVTQDFNPTRLNVMLDKETNTIVSLRCG